MSHRKQNLSTLYIFLLENLDKGTLICSRKKVRIKLSF